MANSPMTAETALNGLMHVTPKLANLLIWLALAVAHLVVAFAAIVAIWWFGISPTVVAATFDHVFQS